MTVLKLPSGVETLTRPKPPSNLYTLPMRLKPTLQPFSSLFVQSVCFVHPVETQTGLCGTIKQVSWNGVDSVSPSLMGRITAQSYLTWAR